MPVPACASRCPLVADLLADRARDRGVSEQTARVWVLGPDAGEDHPTMDEEA